MPPILFKRFSPSSFKKGEHLHCSFFFFCSLKSWWFICRLLFTTQKRAIGELLKDGWTSYIDWHRNRRKQPQNITNSPKEEEEEEKSSRIFWFLSIVFIFWERTSAFHSTKQMVGGTKITKTQEKKAFKGLSFLNQILYRRLFVVSLNLKKTKKNSSPPPSASSSPKSLSSLVFSPTHNNNI